MKRIIKILGIIISIPILAFIVLMIAVSNTPKSSKQLKAEKKLLELKQKEECSHPSSIVTKIAPAVHKGKYGEYKKVADKFKTCLELDLIPKKELKYVKKEIKISNRLHKKAMVLIKKNKLKLKKFIKRHGKKPKFKREYTLAYLEKIVYVPNSIKISHSDWHSGDKIGWLIVATWSAKNRFGVRLREKKTYFYVSRGKLVKVL